mmetsp:Transcript_48212/g.148813  ORF Transcript_48212/g.148813 Transcript_48212/m.148813 type:complete len:498 (+) Transcript_48212:1299-2792(+)
MARRPAAAPGARADGHRGGDPCCQPLRQQRQPWRGHRPQGRGHVAALREAPGRAPRAGAPGRVGSVVQREDGPHRHAVGVDLPHLGLHRRGREPGHAPPLAHQRPGHAAQLPRSSLPPGEAGRLGAGGGGHRRRRGRPGSGHAGGSRGAPLARVWSQRPGVAEGRRRGQRRRPARDCPEGHGAAALPPGHGQRKVEPVRRAAPRALGASPPDPRRRHRGARARARGVAGTLRAAPARVRARRRPQRRQQCRPRALPTRARSRGHHDCGRCPRRARALCLGGCGRLRAARCGRLGRGWPPPRLSDGHHRGVPRPWSLRRALAVPGAPRREAPHQLAGARVLRSRRGRAAPQQGRAARRRCLPRRAHHGGVFAQTPRRCTVAPRRRGAHAGGARRPCPGGGARPVAGARGRRRLADPPGRGCHGGLRGAGSRARRPRVAGGLRPAVRRRRAPGPRRLRGRGHGAGALLRLRCQAGCGQKRAGGARRLEREALLPRPDFL